MCCMCMSLSASVASSSIDFVGASVVVGGRTDSMCAFAWTMRVFGRVAATDVCVEREWPRWSPLRTATDVLEREWRGWRRQKTALLSRVGGEWRVVIRATKQLFSGLSDLERAQKTAPVLSPDGRSAALQDDRRRHDLAGSEALVVCEREEESDRKRARERPHAQKSHATSKALRPALTV